jgi:hypothetical protein
MNLPNSSVRFVLAFALMPAFDSKVSHRIVKLAGQEKREKESQLISATSRATTLIGEIERLNARVREARVALEVGTVSQKAEAIRRMTFKSKEGNKTWGAREVKISFVPQVGEPETADVRDGELAWR